MKSPVAPCLIAARCLISVGALSLAGAALAQHHEKSADMVHATLVGADGKSIGMVMLEQTTAGVLIDVTASGLPAGEHAFHIHEKGTCDVADGFKGAGGHYNPTTHAHGMKDPKGQHAGDMPNQFVAADGNLRAQVLNSAVTLGKGAGTLADADGSALVIHAGVDDYVTQPTGDAGGRIACAVLSAPKK